MSLKIFRQWGVSLGLGFLAMACVLPALAQDLAGAKDHPAVKRFGGSTIVGYEVRNFDAVEFQTSTFKEFDLQAYRRIYVQPPLAVLRELVAVRLHLDPCGEHDGALRVIAGSHQLGRIAADQAARLRVRHAETVCTAAAGDALVMRPLLLHASSRATGNSRRRVLHFLFGPRELPCGLEWAEAG